MPYDYIPDSISAPEKLGHLHGVLNLSEDEVNLVWEDSSLRDWLFEAVADKDILKSNKTRNLLNSFLAEEFDKNVFFLTLNLISVYEANQDFYFDETEINDTPTLFKNIEESTIFLSAIKHLIIPAHPGNLNTIDGMQRH